MEPEGQCQVLEQGRGEFGIGACGEIDPTRGLGTASGNPLRDLLKARDVEAPKDVDAKETAGC
jgi:hypothetical protein